MQATTPLSRHTASPQTNSALGVLLAGAVILAGYVVHGLATALFLGGALAVSCYPAFAALQRRLGGRAHLASALCTVALLMVLVAPLAGGAAFVQHEISAGLAYVRDVMGIESLDQVSLEKIPAGMRQRVDGALTALHVPGDTLRTYLGRALQVLPQVGKKVAEWSTALPLHLALLLMAFFFFLADGHHVPALLSDLLPLRRSQSHELITDLRNAIIAAVLGTAVTAVTQCVAVTLGLVVAGVPHGVFFGLLALPAAFIPVAGSALVWAPAAAMLAATGHPAAALGLTIWCSAVAAVNSNLLKPAVVGNKMALHPGLILVAILGGLQTFGMSGLVAGPLCMAAVWTLVRLHRRSNRYYGPNPAV